MVVQWENVDPKLEFLKNKAKYACKGYKMVMRCPSTSADDCK